MLKGGIIGFGNVGQNLTRVIRERFRDRADIVAVCNRSRAKLDVAREQFGITQLTHDPEELCASDLDFVMVLSSNSVHREHVETAARHGRHVFCEKPIATTIEDADAMVRAVESAGVANCVNYCLRFIPAYMKLRELYLAGEMGEMLSLHCQRLRGFGLAAAGAKHWAVQRPEESGGWVVHHACHSIDFVYWTAGEFKEVYAHTQSTAGGVSELVWGMGRLAGGGTAVVTDSVCAAREHYTTLIGTQGTAIMRGEGKVEILLKREAAKVENREPDAVFQVVDHKQQHDTLDHFFECITKGIPSKATIRDARHSLAVACCMEESARTGRPVSIPPVGEAVRN